MENENATIKLVEALVSSKDGYATLNNYYAELKEKYHNLSSELEALVDIILDNTKLDYSETDLSLVNDNSILAFVRFIDPDTYTDRLEELKKEAQERYNAAANLAENLKKEARKNGKS